MQQPNFHKKRHKRQKVEKHTVDVSVSYVISSFREKTQSKGEEEIHTKLKNELLVRKSSFQSAAHTNGSLTSTQRAGCSNKEG